MPELPEVETIARQLDDIIVGKKIAQVEVLSKKSFQGGEPKKLKSKTIELVDRHAKMVVIHLKQSEPIIVVHLKMTGQLIWRPKRNGQVGEYSGKQIVGGHPSKDWDSSLPNNHTRVIIDFVDGSVLFFNDMRKFGWIKLLTQVQFEQMLEKMPLDIIDDSFDFGAFKSILTRSGRAIKLVLMDQSKMGGIGNIYANDALNLARIDPKRAANKINDSEAKKLYQACRKVVNQGIKFGGATYSNYRDSKGQGGKYQEHFLVYDRQDQKCKNCGGIIQKFTLGGRGTYWCPQCQA